MSHVILEDQLNRLESQLKKLTGSLIDGNPSLLQESSIEFQQLAVELLRMVGDAKRSQWGSPSGSRRISALASEIATLRENLFRRSAYVDGALGVLIPATGEKATYVGSRVYGSVAKRSGGFTAFSA